MKKLAYYWRGLRPGVQFTIKWICFAAFLILLSIKLVGCKSISVEQIDTSRTQRDSRDAANSLPRGNTPEEQAAIDHARRALNTCASDLERVTTQSNQRAEELQKASEERDTFKSKFEVLQKKYDEATSFSSNLAALWDGFTGRFFAFVLGAVVMLTGVIVAKVSGFLARVSARISGA